MTYEVPHKDYIVMIAKLRNDVKQLHYTLHYKENINIEKSPSIRHCEERSDVAIYNIKSFLSGFIWSIILSFLALFQDFICFSRAIASFMLLYSS